MVAPAIFRVLIDLVLSFSPVLAAFPPPKTCLLIKDELSIDNVVLPLTTAVVPFPPA